MATAALLNPYRFGGSWADDADTVLWLKASTYSGSGAWLDGSGQGHDAQLGSAAGADANDPTFSTDHFDLVTNDFFKITNHADLNIGLAESWSAVVVLKRNSNGLYGFLTKYTGGPPYLLLQDDTTGKLAADLHDGTTRVVTASQSMGATGSYITVAAVLNRAAATLRTVVNGTPGTTKPAGSLVAVTNTMPFYIGALEGAGAWYMDGAIKGVAIVKRALSDAETVALGAELVA